MDAEYRAINRQRNAEASTKTRLMKIIEDPRSMLALRPGSQVAKRRVRGFTHALPCGRCFAHAGEITPVRSGFWDRVHLVGRLQRGCRLSSQENGHLHGCTGSSLLVKLPTQTLAVRHQCRHMLDNVMSVWLPLQQAQGWL